MNLLKISEILGFYTERRFDMGYTDTITKEYMRNNAVFADAFNYLIYDGAQVITPERLRELDTTEIAIPFSTENVKNDKHNAVQDYRDILKSAVVMQDEQHGLYHFRY